ncbi:hypothetical protein [Nocardia harenae]|uniref:hypothetical protein n=1 Tax=Nocardia harenae TaxID=358707 RepID=UPI000832296D|nr:hypothetical protein [Nocardia harenae]
MGEGRWFDVVAADAALAELIDAVHTIAVAPAPADREPDNVRRLRAVRARDRSAAGREPGRGVEVAAVTLVSSDGFSVDVAFELLAGTAAARFRLGGRAGPGGVHSARALAGYLANATLHRLTAQGIRAVLTGP